ncbi:hypothetical protein CDV31_015966 [Fusarium ambrosium]|uniref:Uncharacterized protein n=1 Tax=Fusarium ambrosium TaxID=131363 RepID=A0A428SGQ7_9HYPO|nr:hypothetical protein CDV31_015966 [Fusarium ambrosium]
MGQTAKHESSSQTQTQTDTGREVSSAGSDCPASFTVQEGWTETPTCLPDTRKKFTVIFLSFRRESDQASCITSQFPLRIHHLFLRHNRITRCPSALQRVALPVTPATPLRNSRSRGQVFWTASPTKPISAFARTVTEASLPNWALSGLDELATVALGTLSCCSRQLVDGTAGNCRKKRLLELGACPP